jgi:ammonia channel protein AmtB
LGPFFYPEHGAVYGETTAGPMIGVQISAIGAVALWSFIISFIYFFALYRLDVLKLTVAEEVLGMDTVEHASQAGIDIKPLMDKINNEYPKMVKKGC